MISLTRGSVIIMNYGTSPHGHQNSFHLSTIKRTIVTTTIVVVLTQESLRPHVKA